MNITAYTNELERYLQADEVIDFHNPAIIDLAEKLWAEATDEIDYIRRSFEYVRDHIAHSADIDADKITCSASQVLKEGHGVCFAKSHLLAAVLRCRSIPAGLCYQKLILDVNDTPVLVYHGLNGVYIEKRKKWIRLDARGSKEIPNAKFSLEEEILEYSLQPEKGEKDITVVFPNVDAKVLEKMRENKTRRELWVNLPLELAYEGE